MDYLTKWPDVFRVSDQTALTIAHLLVEQVISQHGVPSQLLSDCGPAFLSNLVQECSTSHDFLEDVMNVVDIELPLCHLVRNTEDSNGVVYKEGQNWPKSKTLGAVLGKEQDVTRRMQLAGLAFRCMLGLFAGVSASLELCGMPWSDHDYFMAVEQADCMQQ